MHVSLSVLQTAIKESYLLWAGIFVDLLASLVSCTMCGVRETASTPFSIHSCLSASPVLSCTKSHHSQQLTVEMTAKMEATASREDSASLPFPVFYTDSTAALTSP